MFLYLTLSFYLQIYLSLSPALYTASPYLIMLYKNSRLYNYCEIDNNWAVKKKIQNVKTVSKISLTLRVDKIMVVIYHVIYQSLILVY